jgi:zinc protease
MNLSRLLPLFILFAATGVLAQKANTAPTNSEPVLIERLNKAPIPDDITISYSKYKLANGLILLVSEDHSDPIVHVDVTYHVGSAREESGKSGFAHFFEHMMFAGSKHVGKGEHFRIISQAGGTMNGNTTGDRTKYFETVPKNYLETALWLESDRMGFLLDSVTQLKFEIQRATVKNEKGQNYENRPYGMLGELVDKSLYPFGHPYSWPTIGYVPDLNRVSVEDLKKFFMRWYGPNNAVVTVGGDVNTEDVVKLVQKYFGSIQKGPEVKRMTPDYFALNSDRYVSLEDNIRFPELAMVYPTVPQFHEDEAALDILAEILGGGKSSILYSNFVKTQKAVLASAENDGQELGGQFSFTIRAVPGTKLSEMEAMVRSSFDDFIKRGVTDADIEKIKAQKTASAIFGLESIANKSNLLSEYETLLGNCNYVKADVLRYDNVTKKDVMRVFQIYIKDAHCLIASVYPKGKKDLIAHDDNFVAGGDSSKLKHANYDTLKPRQVVDNFKRNTEPKPGPSPIVNAPVHFIFDEPISMKTIAVPNPEVPDIYMQITVKAGLSHQPKGKEGIAYLATKMMQESSFNMSAAMASDELDKLGSKVNISVDQENIYVSVHCLTKFYDGTLGIVNEMVLHSKVDPIEFKKVKDETLQLIANQSTQANTLANVSFSQLLYGKDHPYGGSVLGTRESVQNITAEDVASYIRENMTGPNSQLAMSGDIKEKDLRRMLIPMGAWTPMPGKQGTLPATAPAIDKTKIYLVNKTNAAQSEIRIGYLALPYDATGDFYKANVMNYALGGAFNSRLNQNIREQRGYTYGIRSGFEGNHSPGAFVVSTGVRANITDSALVGIIDIMKAYSNKGITKKELEFTKSSYIEREALKYETNQQKAAYAQRLLDYKLKDDFPAEEAAIVKKLSKKDIDNLAKQYLPMDKMVIVIVGDAKMLKEKLSKTGYEIVEMNPIEDVKQ